MSQVIVFLSRLNGEPIGFSVLGILVVDKNTIVMVNWFLFRLLIFVSL